MKTTKQKELLSIKITKLFIVILAVITAIMSYYGPTIVRFVMIGKTPMLPDVVRFWVLLVAGYICASLFLVFLYLLFKLVGRIEKGEVFVDENVNALSTLSKLVLAACFITFAVSLTCDYLTFVLTVATAFVTPVIRVVKNAFGKAVEIKNELDLTV